MEVTGTDAQRVGFGDLPEVRDHGDLIFFCLKTVREAIGFSVTKRIAYSVLKGNPAVVVNADRPVSCYLSDRCRIWISTRLSLDYVIVNSRVVAAVKCGPA